MAERAARAGHAGRAEPAGHAPRVPAAQLLESRTDEVLAAYEAALRSTESSLLRDEQLARRYVAEARRILAHVVAELRSGTYLPAGTETLGSPPEPPGGPRTHPVESGRAATALFDAVVVALLGDLSAARLRDADAAVLFSLLHRQVLARHTARAVAHIGYLLERVHSAHNDERRRIARELHDEVAGHLGSALNGFELHDLYLPDRPELAREKLGAARETVRGSLGALRDVMGGLRRQIDAEPLRAALLRDLEDAGEHAPDVRVSVTGDESWVPAVTSDELLLILREAQRNAVRHARARLVRVAVHVAPGEVRGSVEDDGVGFDATAAPPRGHGGMLSMRERAELLGGSVTVESRPGCGTRVLVFIPLEGEPDDDRP
ncbi:sensor histidine kinase [Streptomyces sp. JJ36]|uniref:sensor histidine kinase n=1 Tax=Streptomyces sp. JJ36 TaxID=2736645 RepID=UPI001F3F9424|nr:sensor histidine kinase [Streptomyces sp. JJ36]MCF6524508.1 sensor histidine kinase [Streptomyces sp. JJ36]